MTNIFQTSKKTTRIIKNEDALGYEYVPKLLPFREGQVEEIANSIKPMLQGSKGTNLFIYGAPGIGKTASIKWVLRELNEHTDDINTLYVNCWNNRTKYFMFLEMANQLKISFTAGKSAEHLLQQIEYKLKNKNAVFIFDEIDKSEDSDFLYQIIEKFPKSTIVLSSNMFDYVAKMDARIKSRAMLRNLEFKPYSIMELNKIIKERAKSGLIVNSIDPSFIKQIANITHNKRDVRVGLFLLREAARNAELNSRKKIKQDDIQPVIEQLEKAKIGDEEKLNSDEMMMLETIKENTNEVIGIIFKKYEERGGGLSYRSFKRYIDRLEKLGLIKTETTGAGFKGKSTIISIK